MSCSWTQHFDAAEERTHDLNTPKNWLLTLMTNTNKFFTLSKKNARKRDTCGQHRNQEQPNTSHTLIYCTIILSLRIKPSFDLALSATDSRTVTGRRWSSEWKSLISPWVGVHFSDKYTRSEYLGRGFHRPKRAQCSFWILSDYIKNIYTHISSNIALKSHIQNKKV